LPGGNIQKSDKKDGDGDPKTGLNTSRIQRRKPRRSVLPADGRKREKREIFFAWGTLKLKKERFLFFPTFLLFL
jgi:hypothetical protein